MLCFYFTIKYIYNSSIDTNLFYLFLRRTTNKQYKPMSIIQFLNYLLTLELLVWILSLQINRIIHNQRFELQHFVYSFFLYNRVVLRNTFSKKEKEFKIYSNRINLIAYILFGITLLLLIPANMILNK